MEVGTLRRLVELAAPEKKLIAAATVALGINSAANLSIPAGMGKIIGIGQSVRCLGR